jgi:hypothetical protein
MAVAERHPLGPADRTALAGGKVVGEPTGLAEPDPGRTGIRKRKTVLRAGGRVRPARAESASAIGVAPGRRRGFRAVLQSDQYQRRGTRQPQDVHTSHHED